MSTMQTQNEMNLTTSIQEIKNRIRSRILFNSIIIKLLFVTILLLNLSLQVQFQVNKIMLFIVLKKKRINIQIIITFLDSLFITSFLVNEKLEQALYLYSNIILLCSLLINCYRWYTDRGMLDTIRTLNKTTTIFRLYILICSTFVSLKLDKIINWEWSAALWSLWLGLFCSIGISLGCLIVTFNKIVQYLFEKSNYQKSKIIYFIWFAQLSIYITVCLGLTSLGYLEILTNKLNYSRNFIILQYFVIAELIIIMFYSIYFHTEINEYILSILQDDEPLSNQQQLSTHTQRNNQTLQNLNVITSRTQVPQVMQKISTAYFSIPKRQINKGQDSINGSPIIKKSSKGHKRAFSSQGIGSQMIQELDLKITEKQLFSINQTIKNKPQVEKKRSNSQLITIARDESIQNQKIDISQTSNICIVCYERGPNAVFMNCGHGGTCYQCAVDIWKQKTECYLCREKIVYILKVDLEERFGDLFKVVSTTKMMDQFQS
ncbi:unnamed protein product [Paramecium sonneborni]|uniref:RING-type domain-containing protein n=1 Tax=Paramecium sonneborni TaxID=65129 RepID=A0A8S1QU76_9CILI|nr:unnamed protein product [Paramecium sonneborni]